MGFLESSKFRVTNLLWRSFVFLDETKILSYCGPKEILNCVIPVNGKLLSTLVFSDPCRVQVNSIAHERGVLEQKKDSLDEF